MKQKQINKYCAVPGCCDLVVNSDRCEEHYNEYLVWLNDPKKDDILIQ